MGSELGVVNNSSFPDRKSPSILFYEQLPFYLSIGMTYEQYWDGDALLAKYYREAFYMSRARRNQELWLQGAYIYKALECVSPLLHAFAKSGTKAHSYIAEPFPLTEREVREAKEREEQRAYEQQKAAFMARIQAINNNSKKEVSPRG